MKVLIIDNNIDSAGWGAEDLRRQFRGFSGTTIAVRRAPLEDLPRDVSAFDRIVISGSKTSATEDAPWISRLLEFIRTAVDRGKPVLGVCYGHQCLIRSFGGPQAVRQAERAEFGWSRIDVLQDSPFFKGLPKSFYSFSSHVDEAAQLPPGFKLLARSELCPIQACELEGKPVFGIQFHPERSLSEAENTIRDWKKDPKKKKYLLNPDTSEKIFDESVGRILFANFMKL